MNASDSLKLFAPEIFLLVSAFVILFLDFVVQNKKVLSALGIAALAGTALLATSPVDSYPLFFGFFTLDAFTHFFRYLAIGIVAVVLLATSCYKPLSKNYQGEFVSLFLFMTFGLILMAASTNLLMIFLSIEFVSVLSYLLVGFQKRDARSKEAAIKYLLFGSVASGLMLYGMSFLFGLSGSLDLLVIGENVSREGFHSMATISFLFLLAGLGFKISMAPFHMWAPDVYEGAPTPVTAFLTVGPKALGFAVFTRVLWIAFPWLSSEWSFLIMMLSILTMTIGNVVAVAQTNIKRLLAYSSIAQAGYILMGVVTSFSQTGFMAVLVYLIAYAFTNLGAFIVVIIASNHFSTDEISAYAGLGKRSPFLAATLALFFLSLAGIPPLAGFIGKWLVFSSAIETGFYTLAIAAALNSAVAAFYYFKVIRIMYLVQPENDTPINHPSPLMFALCLMLIAIVFMGLAPSPFINFVQGVLNQL